MCHSQQPLWWVLNFCRHFILNLGHPTCLFVTRLILISFMLYPQVWDGEKMENLKQQVSLEVILLKSHLGAKEAVRCCIPRQHWWCHLIFRGRKEYKVFLLSLLILISELGSWAEWTGLCPRLFERLTKKSILGEWVLCSAWGCCFSDKEGKWLNTRLLVCLEFLCKHDGTNRAAFLLISSMMAAQGKLLYSSIYCWSN